MPLRAGAVSLSVSALTVALAAIAEVRPFLNWTHTWVAAVLFAVFGLALLVVGASALAHGPTDRFAAVGSLGGALAALSLVYAAFAVGEPQRVVGVPGQVFRPSARASVQLKFPDVRPGELSAGRSPQSVAVMAAGRSIALQARQTVRSGPYVFTAVSGPLALVSATTPGGAPVTVTQPDSPDFLSAYLTFPLEAGGRPADSFALPALHRNVDVAFYAGLPQRGIHVPFLVVGISEEHGSPLSRGVAVSGRTVERSGIRLRFVLGTYPIVLMTSAPPLVPFGLSVAMLIGGVVGYLARAVAAERLRGAAR
ncbi:MAG: hypothetical protein M3T49_08445 [Candidatus Eremiobacteraeota bacterium]|nr:hypothetical protein [Candidatus Eremiobacteraeota bacterium]